MKKLLLLLLPLLFFTSLLRAEVSLDVDALAQLAVQDHGRKKPFTTFARESLLTLSGRSSLPLADSEEALPPESVILNLWLKPEGWDQKPVVFVTFRALKEKLGLPLESEQKLFSYQQLIGAPALSELLDEADKLRAAGRADDLTSLQKEAEHLGERLKLFQDLVNGQKENIVPHPSELQGRWVPVQNLGTGPLAGSVFSIWPKVDLGVDVQDYYSEGDSVQKVRTDFYAWYLAYRKDDLVQFNSLTPQLASDLRTLSPRVYPAAEMLAFEHHYLTLHPFRWAWIIYLLAVIVLGLTALWARTVGYYLTWALVLLGFGFEIYGLYCRVVISGRPPVTNMYETVIWVSFGAMLFAIILEAIYRRRYFFAAGIPASVITLIIADTQPTILDSSINPLTAVLRNNMWLMIHVLTIVSSYAAFVLAAALGHLALILQMRGQQTVKERAEVHHYIYRAMQIGVLLLAAGTILGGVWANYSWGRFWGWDPKETWALITLLCYLALLHGRLAGWWGGFGLALGSVLCFLSVLMSWYGVNYVLGKGLHSYGFGTGGFSYVLVFVLAELAFVMAAVWWIQRRQMAK